MAYSTIRPIPEIFTDLVSQVTGLVRTESQLARAEISEKATRALSGMAMILLGMVLLIPALVVLLGMILGLIGWSMAKPASLVPDKTIDQLKRDAEVPRHSSIAANYGETGGTTSERMARQEMGNGDQRNRAA
jgi:putative superfamily III holin-X